MTFYTKGIHTWPQSIIGFSASSVLLKEGTLVLQSKLNEWHWAPNSTVKHPLKTKPQWCMEAATGRVTFYHLNSLLKSLCPSVSRNVKGWEWHVVHVYAWKSHFLSLGFFPLGSFLYVVWIFGQSKLELYHCVIIRESFTSFKTRPNWALLLCKVFPTWHLEGVSALPCFMTPLAMWARECISRAKAISMPSGPLWSA